MPTKTTKTASKSVAKPKVSKSSLIKKGRTFDLRIVALIAAVLILAIGFIFVRLSKAATEVPCTLPLHQQNCYRLPNDPRASQSGGIILAKQAGTVSWAGDGSDTLVFTDQVYDKARLKYCFYIEYTGDTVNTLKITVNNQTTPAELTQTTQLFAGRSPANNPQTVKCTDTFQMNGNTANSVAGRTPQVNEIKLTVTGGSLIAYKLVRAPQDIQNPQPVEQTSPGALKPAAATPAPAATTNPAGKPVAATPAPTAAQTQAPAATSNPAQKPAATQAPAPPAAPECPQQINGQGNQGGCVTLIQQRLVNLGYDPGAVDGVFGDKTFSAVKVFQNKNGLTVDGVVGPNTWARLFDPNAARKS